MSGSNDSTPSRVGGGGGVNGGGNDCANVLQSTILNSPNPLVINTLHIGDVLRIVLLSSTGPLVVQTNSGQTAGSITSASLHRLIECINNGFHFIAIVVEIDGGRCTVEVRSSNGD